MTKQNQKTMETKAKLKGGAGQRRKRNGPGRAKPGKRTHTNWTQKAGLTGSVDARRSDACVVLAGAQNLI